MHHAFLPKLMFDVVITRLNHFIACLPVKIGLYLHCLIVKGLICACYLFTLENSAESHGLLKQVWHGF